MATARTRTRNKVDTRKLNEQPNNHPANIVVTAFTEGEEIDFVEVPQNVKLSDKGAVTYKGGIAGGWEMEGAPVATLNSLSYVIDGVTLKPSAERAHDSSKGNPTIFHGGTITVPVAGQEPKKYQVQVWTTYSLKHEAYSLDVKAFPVAIGTGRPRGPQVVGRVGSGFSLRPEAARVEAGA